jgi:uncharacterized membrane protein
MKHIGAVLTTSFALLASQAHAQVTFEYIFDSGYPLAVSHDGSVIAGNDLDYTSFRWTEETGMVSLGRPQLVGGGGTPAISADGTRIAYGIGSLDGSYTTPGLWTLGSGWQELMPPTPPDGGTVDGSYGNVWSLSGDGSTVVGLYWRPGVGKRAHASKWTQATGVVDLGGCASGQASRANGANNDASVIVGWVETGTGPWRPAAWVDGSLVLLTNYQEVGGIPVGSGEARATSPNGDIIVGFARDQASNRSVAAMWTRTNGVFGPVQVLGYVDGTEPGGLGKNIAHAVTADGSRVVGYCTFDGSPFSTTGFIWTASTGVIDINQWLGSNGVIVPADFMIESLNAMTPDGGQIFGYGQLLVPPYTRRAFRITAPSVTDVTPSRIVDIALSAPYPNPSHAATQLEFALPSAASVDLSVFDTAGRRVATLMRGEVPVGTRSVTWDGRGADGRPVAAGVYFARLNTPHGSVVQRIARLPIR